MIPLIPEPYDSALVERQVSYRRVQGIMYLVVFQKESSIIPIVIGVAGRALRYLCKFEWDCPTSKRPENNHVCSRILYPIGVRWESGQKNVICRRRQCRPQTPKIPYDS